MTLAVEPRNTRCMEIADARFVERVVRRCWPRNTRCIVVVDVFLFGAAFFVSSSRLGSRRVDVKRVGVREGNRWRGVREKAVVKMVLV